MKQKDVVLNISGAKNKKNEKSNKTMKKNNSQIEEAMDENNGQIHITELAKDEEIHRINKKILDLSLHDSNDNQNKIASKQEYKFRLPVSATKT